MLPPDSLDSALRSALLAACALAVLPALGFRVRRVRVHPAFSPREELVRGALRALRGLPVGVVPAVRFVDPRDAARAEDYWFSFSRLRPRELDCLLVSLSDGRPLAALELDDGCPARSLPGVPVVRVGLDDLGPFRLRARLEPHLRG